MATSIVKVNFLGDEKDLRRAFDSAASASKSFGNRIQDDLKSVGRFALNAAKVIAGIGAAIVGITLKGGLDRALNIEDARAKLQGLGHDAETVETIMDSALDSVKGTAFGLDEAATIAASAVASGIEPGQELTQVLTTVADAATIAGVPLNEMGAIFNKVQANGRMMTEEMNQLQDRGIPILQWLQEEFGVTAEEMRKMVTEGAVDAETFRDAIENNISGAALESGQTTRGALANVGAAFSRLGATLVEKFFPLAKTVFEGLIEGADNLTAKVGPAMDAFTESQAFATLQEHAERIPEYMEAAVEVLIDFWEATGDVRDAIGNFVAGLGVLFDAAKVVPPEIAGITLAMKGFVAHPGIAAIAIIVGAIGELGEAARETAEAHEDLVEQLAEGTTSVEDYAAAQAEAIWMNADYRDALKEAGLTAADVRDAILGNVDAQERLAEATDTGIGGIWETNELYDEEMAILNDLNEVIGIHTGAVEGAEEAAQDLRDAEAELQTELFGTGESFDRAGGAAKRWRDAQNEAEGATEEATGAIEGEIDALNELRDAKRRDVDATFNLIESSREAKTAREEYTTAVEEHGAASDEAIDAAEELWGKEQNLIDAAFTFRDEAGPGWESGFRTMMESAGVSAETIQAVIDKVANLDGTIADVNGSEINIKANVSVPKFRFDQDGNYITPSQVGTAVFARGGVVTGPTVGLMGEAGDEAVLPLEGRGIHILAEAFREALGMGVGSNGSGPAPSSNGGLTVKIDTVYGFADFEDKVAEAVVRARRRGVKV